MQYQGTQTEMGKLSAQEDPVHHGALGTLCKCVAIRHVATAPERCIYAVSLLILMFCW